MRKLRRASVPSTISQPPELILYNEAAQGEKKTGDRKIDKLYGFIATCSGKVFSRNVLELVLERYRSVPQKEIVGDGRHATHLIKVASFTTPSSWNGYTSATLTIKVR